MNRSAQLQAEEQGGREEEAGRGLWRILGVIETLKTDNPVLANLQTQDI